MGIVVSKRSHTAGVFGLHKKWGYYIGKERTFAAIAAVVLSVTAYSVGKALSRTQVAAVPPSVAATQDDSQARGRLEAAAHRIALAWAAAHASGVEGLADPQQLVGTYLSELPALPSEARNFAWQFSGYALKMRGIPEALCHIANQGPAYPAEQRKAGLQCHGTEEGMLTLTYRLDAVPQSDTGFYKATLTVETKNRVPVARLALSDEQQPNCTAESEYSGVVSVPADKDVSLAEASVCIPALAWETLKYQAGTIVTTAPEKFAATFRSGEAAHRLTAQVVPVGSSSESLAWSLKLDSQAKP